MTGEVLPVQTMFRERQQLDTYIATNDGILGGAALDPATRREVPWTWHSSGPRIWMTNDAGTSSRRILQTWHSDRRDLDRQELTALPCFKTYTMMSSAWPSWAGDPGALGSSFVRGVGAKLTSAQAATYPEVLRLKRAHPDFFADAGKV